MPLIKKNVSPSKGCIGRFLITVNVIGSTGPLRFLVNKDDQVATVIRKALRLYTRQGRLPVLGSDLNGFVLYGAGTDWESLSPCDTIGSRGVRSFLLYQKPEAVESNGSGPECVGKKKIGRWKSWLKRSLNFGISSE